MCEEIYVCSRERAGCKVVSCFMHAYMCGIGGKAGYKVITCVLCMHICVYVVK